MGTRIQAAMQIDASNNGAKVIFYNLTLLDRFGFTWKWDRRTDYKPAAPCLAIEIVAGAASPVTSARRADGSRLLRACNAILVFT